MASSAAQQMFNSLSPQEQQQVQASIAGNPNGLDDWYQNAARAGDPRAIRAGGSGQSEDFERFNPGTLTGWAQGFYDEAASRAAGRPQFRSMRGEQGYFDKPTECPPGMGPSGPNESDPCTTKGYSEPAVGGGATTAPGAATGASGPSQQQLDMSMLYSPLRGLLENQGHFLRGFDPNPGDGQAGVRGGIMGGGGMWWSPTQGQTSAAPVQTGGMELKPATASGVTGSVPGQSGVYGGYNPGGGTSPGGIFSQPGGAQQGGAEAKQGHGAWSPANPYGGYNPAANTSSLANVLTPLQSQAAPSPLAGAVMPFQAQQRKKDPLTGMLSGFSTKQGGSWF